MATLKIRPNYVVLIKHDLAVKKKSTKSPLKLPEYCVIVLSLQ